MNAGKKFKEFGPSSWAIDNRTTIFVLTLFLVIMGLRAYRDLPKELFPDVTLPTVYVATAYPGSAPADIENLITRPLEKEIGAINGVYKITSNSVQDFSAIQVEFVSGTDINAANQLVKDAVDKAKPKLPGDLDPTWGPNVSKIEFADFPILQVNVSGDYDLGRLKRYAELLQDQIEQLPQIARVDLIGAPEREIQVDVDMYQMQVAQVTLFDIYSTISNENRLVSGGTIRIGDMRRSITISGEFQNLSDLENLTINNLHNQPIPLKQLATITDGFKEQESYARLNDEKVITLSVIKKSGENLIEASDSIRALVNRAAGHSIPSDIDLTITGDTSTLTRTQVKELINTIIIGFILVTLVLMFFMGAADAMFVAFSVPLSMFLAFIVLSLMGWSMNVIVLFAFLLGLGIVVDDAIVVIENTHRLFGNGKMPIKQAAKYAAGEVFVPVLSGTLTTLAPFFPLLFWPGIIGQFMEGLPVTLIITLTASLLVAYLFNPVFAATFMRPQTGQPPQRRRALWLSVAAVAAGLILSLSGAPLVGNLLITAVLLYWLYQLVLIHGVRKFQNRIWPQVQARYAALLRWTLDHPVQLFGGIMALFIVSLILIGIQKPGVEQFPSGDPNAIYAYIVMPSGTDAAVTDSITREVERRIQQVLGPDNPIVKSVISSVALGASEDPFDQSVSSHKGKVAVNFIDPAERRQRKSEPYLEQFRSAVRDLRGASITISAEQNGPPQGKPINIQIAGDDLDQLIQVASGIKRHLDSLNIAGIEELKADLQPTKPEIVVQLDRERMNRLGINTQQVGFEIRNAIFGWEASRYKEQADDFPIVIRYAGDQRKNVERLKELKITYRDMTTGQVKQVPLSAFATIAYSTTYSAIKRLDQKRVITLESNLLSGYENRQPMIMGQIKELLADYPLPEGVTLRYAGASQDIEETINFLSIAWFISLFLIIFILVTQFNSVSKPLIIFAEVFFSIIGVLLGYGLTGMTASIVMTGVGVVALLGIVVRNGILLVEFTDVLIEQGIPLREAVVEAARIRMTPVLLTATAAILGMIPLAIGMNIDFYGLFTAFKPDIWLGGENVVFWGPLAWTIIFGLSFATFVTLLVVPVMYLLNERFRSWLFRKLGLQPQPVTAGIHAKTEVVAAEEQIN
ncbi:MAG: efflux RND transporter permease subunit [Chitinophagales bacterium]|nr:efflux RND transporter permease subunit [Chitinophagales bacterium]MDW8393917.1 efflux RND transporter permease subunit [Chitinophagales bacterium]